MGQLPNYESSSARFVAEVLEGSENPFWTLEAMGENMNQIYTELHKLGMDIGSIENGRRTLPSGQSKRLMEHLQAVSDYEQKLFNYFAALLPAVYQFSDHADEQPMDADERQHLRELIRYHESKWADFMSTLGK